MKENYSDTEQIKNNKAKTATNILYLVTIAILILLLLKKCCSNNQQDILNAQNIAALNDTIRIEKNKAGEEMALRKSLVTTKENLEALNKNLYDEIKKIKGDVITIHDVQTVLDVDTQYVNNTVTVYADGNYSLDFKFDTTFSEGNYRKFSGNSFFSIDSISHKINPGNTRINEDEMGFSFVTGLREKDGALEIFVNPKYPDMKVTSIEGAVIDPQKSDVLKSMFPDKKWSVGPYLGVGIGAKVLGTPSFGPVINIGVGVQYSWWKF
jgi:hypothetical protein